MVGRKLRRVVGRIWEADQKAQSDHTKPFMVSFGSSVFLLTFVKIFIEILTRCESREQRKSS